MRKRSRRGVARPSHEPGKANEHFLATPQARFRRRGPTRGRFGREEEPARGREPAAAAGYHGRRASQRESGGSPATAAFRQRRGDDQEAGAARRTQTAPQSACQGLGRDDPRVSRRRPGGSARPASPRSGVHGRHNEGPTRQTAGGDDYQSSPPFRVRGRRRRRERSRVEEWHGVAESHQCRQRCLGRQPKRSVARRRQRRAARARARDWLRDQAFEALFPIGNVGDGIAFADGTSTAGDHKAALATFEELAVAHATPIRSLMLEVRWGEAQTS